MGGVLIYRCRNCGALMRNLHTPDVLTSIICLTLDIPMPKTWAGTEMAKKVDIHHCNAKTIGVADLIGGAIDA